MDTIEWLLDGDPAIRWQVRRDLTAASAEVVAAERARVEHEGWGARLLALQGPDGLWAGGACFPADHADDEPGSSRGRRRCTPCRPCRSSAWTRSPPPPVAPSPWWPSTAAGSTPASATSTVRWSRASTAAPSR